MIKISYILIISLPILLSCSTGLTSQDADKSSSDIERAKLLVSEYGCISCHTPKIETSVGFIPDPNRLLSGHSQSDEDLPNIPEGLIGDKLWAGIYSKSLTAWAGPWGIRFAANLTPHKETGIGNWSKQNFISTIRLGIHTTSLARELVPAMPWRDISKLGDDDLGAIYSYLMSLRPVNNKVPEPVELKE